jgi:glycosyltransferase involved in cell wall biosynthesis
MLISIIIPSYNAGATIIKTLTFLYQQDYSDKIEIIVVNSSQDNTKEVIHRKFPDVNVVQLEKRAYTGDAKNIGLKKAKGDIIAFIDSDCIPEKNWLSTIKSLYLKGNKIVGGAIGNINPENIVSKAEYLLELVQLSPGSRTRYVSLISTANCFFTKEIFEKYGNFPTIRKGVDMLFSYSLMKKKEKILFSPEMKIYHACTTGFIRYFKKQILHGEYSILARKEAGMPGSFLSNNFIFIPFLPFIRTFFILRHVISLDIKLTKDLVQSFSILLCGILAWSFGCAKSMLK